MCLLCQVNHSFNLQDVVGNARFHRRGDAQRLVNPAGVVKLTQYPAAERPGLRGPGSMRLRPAGREAYSEFMSESSSHGGRRNNIHAPWRIEYIRSLADADDGCFLCNARDQHDNDVDNLLLWRTPRCLVVLNRFPYTGGHLLIAPNEHVGSLDDLPGEVLRELMELARDAVKVLTHAIRAEGFNVGFNIGRCAGAGLPGHIHLHVVPRWSGDTNFMAVLGETRVIPQALAELREELLAAAEELKLPSLQDDGPAAE